MTYRRCAIFSLCLLLANFSLAAAPAWEFQDTGFDAGQFDGSDAFGTALTFRDGFAWPVIHAPDRNAGELLRSYSLFAAVNPATQTNWFELGSGAFIGRAGSSPPRLRGVSNAAGEYAVSFQDFGSSNPTNGVTLLGNSASGGFGTVLPGVGAFDFAPGGGSLTPLNTTPPGVSADTIVDIAASPSGEVSVVTKQDRFSNEFSIWINNPLIGWQSTTFDFNTGAPFTNLAPSTIDLAYDSSPRPTPHLVGVDANSGVLAAYDFDPRTAEWRAQTLDQVTNFGQLPAVALADNGAGVLGAAWVSDGELKYAYRDTNVISPTWAVTTVRDITANFDAIDQQAVGLAFDFNGLPAISFVELDQNNGDFNVFLAYDPPAVVAPGGDFNFDGAVNAADYAVLRDGFGAGFSAENYDAWRANFGSGLGATAAGAPQAAAVPEPGAAVLLVAALLAPPCRRIA